MAARQKNRGATPASRGKKKATASKTGAASRDVVGRFQKPNPWTWEPGQSGNPNGRPKRRTLTEDLAEIGRHGTPKEWLRDAATALGLDPDSPEGAKTLEGLTIQQAFAASLYRRALRDGNLGAAAEIFDRLDPKPKRVEISGRDGAPIQGHVAVSDLSDEDAAVIYKQLVDGDGEG